MISKLTKKQVAAIPAHIDKWVKWAVHNPSRDDATIENNIQMIYEDIGRSRPRVIVCHSIKDFVRETVRYARSQVESQVRSQVWSQVESQVWSQVESQVWSQVESQVWSQVESQVESQVRSQVRSQVWSQVESQVWSQVESQVWSQVYYFADNIAFNDYFLTQTGLNCPQDIKDAFYKYVDLIADTVFGYFHDEVVVVLSKPKVSTNGTMPHSEIGPAIEFSGEGYYYLNGVSFPEELWKKVVSGEMSFSDRMKIEDVDQRTQAINPKYCDINLFLKESKAELLDEVNKFDIEGNPVNYKLYKIPRGEIFQEDAYYCYFDCPTTRKKHLEGVEVSKTVAEAQAWAMSDDVVTVTPKQWSLMVPLVDEN